MLNHDPRLYPHHVDPAVSYDFGHSVAEVSRHPRIPGQWGLKNLGAGKWALLAADGTVTDVEPGRNANLANNVRINFGGFEGEVRA